MQQPRELQSTTKRGRTGKLFTFLTGMFLVIVSVHFYGLAFNVTDSMPIGFYHVEHAALPVTKGTIAQVCLPAAIESMGLRNGYLGRGTCPAHATPVLKILAATGGDRVTLEDKRILVNGHVLPGSETAVNDTHHRPLEHVPRGSFVLAKDQIWLWTPNPKSWDSRYYGPANQDDVIGKATLLLSFGKWPFASHDILATHT